MTQHITPDGRDDDDGYDDDLLGFVHYDYAGKNDATTLCLDCDAQYAKPQNASTARIHDRDVYGKAVPHLRCDTCGKKITDTGSGGP